MTEVKLNGEWCLLVLANDNTSTIEVVDSNGCSHVANYDDVQDERQFYPSVVPEDQLPDFNYETMMRERDAR